MYTKLELLNQNLVVLQQYTQLHARTATKFSRHVKRLLIVEAINIILIILSKRASYY